MNTKLLSALTATAAATALFGAAAPAQAFSFGTNGIRFGEDTSVTFKFKESHGMYQSSLGVYSVDGPAAPTLIQTLFSETKSSDKDNDWENEWKGTLGNTVTGSGSAVFTFLANKIYTLGLNSGNDGSVYSTSALNKGSQQAVFGGQSQLWNALGKETTDIFQAAGKYTNGTGSLFNGGTLISFDDGGNSKDADFQDFAVSAEAVPEPMTMTGLALGFGGLVAARRRRANKTAS
ncbi:PEP-CTERM sorting domain-containing protein [Microcoleus vaginatus GB1-A2]|uniref:PEP-CTERM sorting domain-containing protein n=1 Tax=Microcoleus vaginatus TaxID=119532 RepID=UPI001687C43F|nr:PEP-CTERM sorting domain-containing protein [Microcoleus sp. FACHB-61]